MHICCEEKKIIPELSTYDEVPDEYHLKSLNLPT